MDEKCISHDGFEIRLNNVEKDIKNVEKHVGKIDIRVEVLEKNTALDNQKFTMLLENLGKLPDAINDMKDAMILMQGEIKDTNRKTDDMKEQIQKLNDKVCAIDDEGQFNIRIFLQKNFPILVGLIMGGTGLYAWVNALM